MWNNGGNLNAYLNTGSGFDTSSVFSLPGLPGVMDAERQNSFNFGISATLFPMGGALSWQESWSLGQGGFMDVTETGLSTTPARGAATMR